MLAGFISDLHLREAGEALTRILLSYLNGPARDLPRLYILGDLFEAWVGDDDDGALPAQVAEALSRLSAAGTAVHFQHGNRDFLLGADYARRAGMRLLPDPCVVDLGGQAVLLSHGDRYCTDDEPYQAFRRQVRDPAWQQGFLSRPLAERQAFAARARAESAAHQKSQSMELGDVNRDSVEAELALFGVDRLIHGHTHRPDQHNHEVGGRRRERWVLADWRTAGEVLLIGADGRPHRQTLD
ncbi:UDP-2,3-diacylglucosamine diphosphatase [Pseudomarimonas salicorniae]|uniref:UDP-2,3-diacylglucosamine hydrolase n=1 Tax=Pseudomarimonas salicorniae TaxID=2933270 RepID=A0ABT0GFN4_9GAMM|nr:UDP-2,3-diacylglucosamine diphosphatase [Lysobacter sp. CAU 1642]MCK7593348.1 UDP-2,3-diacylglucosamine diphosphatase [Lysobacter sp. CAU 1642]